MTNRTTRITALTVAVVLAAPALAGSARHAETPAPQDRHVPAGDDFVDWLFGGPRYYDRQMITAASGRCAYHRVGPDGNAVNDVNDHYCGK